MRVAPKVGNLHSKFGHARPLGSRIIRYVRDEQTDGQTDRRTDGRTKATLIASFPYGRRHNKRVVRLWAPGVKTPVAASINFTGGGGRNFLLGGNICATLQYAFQATDVQTNKQADGAVA